MRKWIGLGLLVVGSVGVVAIRHIAHLQQHDPRTWFTALYPWLSIAAVGIMGAGLIWSYFTLTRYRAA